MNTTLSQAALDFGVHLRAAAQRSTSPEPVGGLRRPRYAREVAREPDDGGERFPRRYTTLFVLVAVGLVGGGFALWWPQDAARAPQPATSGWRCSAVAWH